MVNIACRSPISWAYRFGYNHTWRAVASETNIGGNILVLEGGGIMEPRPTTDNRASVGFCAEV
jgi:hypothetical protein